MVREGLQRHKTLGLLERHWGRQRRTLLQPQPQAAQVLDRRPSMPTPSLAGGERWKTQRPTLSGRQWTPSSRHTFRLPEEEEEEEEEGEGEERILLALSVGRSTSSLPISGATCRPSRWKGGSPSQRWGRSLHSRSGVAAPPRPCRFQTRSSSSSWATRSAPGVGWSRPLRQQQVRQEAHAPMVGMG